MERSTIQGLTWLISAMLHTITATSKVAICAGKDSITIENFRNSLQLVGNKFYEKLEKDTCA